jgi:predicted NBD/HSP70 family sugar kinase
MSQLGASSAERVLSFLLTHDATATRPEMADACDLSRPTVLAAVERLEELGLVEAVGQRSGLPGRSAALYEVSRRAGLVGAIDIGGSNLRVALTDVRGRTLAEIREPTTVAGGPEVTHRAAALLADVLDTTIADGQPLSAVAVSVPGVVAADGATIHYAWNIGQPDPYDIRTPLTKALGAPVILDNNVNLAAVGERWRGAAQHLKTFAVIAVGAGVGAGIVHDGQVLRGAHGAAGEVAFLPAAPHYGRPPTGTADEAGGITLLRKAREHPQWSGSAPASVEELFARAAQGEGAASDLVEEESRRIAVIAASICAVIDPEAIILTGGVGANEALVRRTDALVHEMAPFPPAVLRSALGERASLVGAVALGTGTIQARLLGRLSDPATPTSVRQAAAPQSTHLWAITQMSSLRG